MPFVSHHLQSVSALALRPAAPTLAASYVAARTIAPAAKPLALEQSLELPSLGISISLAEVFAKVSFVPSPIRGPAGQ